MKKFLALVIVAACSVLAAATKIRIAGRKMLTNKKGEELIMICFSKHKVWWTAMGRRILVTAVLVSLSSKALPAFQTKSPQSIEDAFAAIAKQVPAFGGMYVSPDKTLQIYLLDTSPPVITAAKAAITEVLGRGRTIPVNIKPLQAKYGFLQLKAWRDRGKGVLSIQGSGRWGIDESMNRLMIGLEQMEAKPIVEKYLSQSGIPLEAVEFKSVKPIGYQNDPEAKARPLIGGTQIAGPSFLCTLGFVAERAGVDGFVTCSHCTITPGGVENTIYNQPSASKDPTIDNAVAIETVDPPYFTGGNCPSGKRCRVSDSAFAAIKPGITAQRGDIISPPGSISSSNLQIKQNTLFPLNGDYVIKVGRTTGWTAGIVTDTCTDINVNKTDRTLLCQDMVAATSDHGDSGSPVFSFVDPINAPTAVSLGGILGGGDEAHTEFFFSPLGNIIAELGVLSVTEFDKPPTISITEPSNNSSVPYGAFGVTFSASVNDFEGGPNCCLITWESDKDGVLGTGASIQFTFHNLGPRTIKASAREKSGASAVASIAINVTNSAPTVSILKPAPGQKLFKGAPFVFSGTSLDSETFFPLPCDKLHWTSSNPLDKISVSGCAPPLTFSSDGVRKITLSGTDEKGATGTASVVIIVGELTANLPPAVTILKPADNTSLSPSQIASLAGSAKSASPVNKLTYKWILAPDTTLGSGVMQSNQQISLSWKPRNNIRTRCGGTNTRIYLYVTDANNLTGFSFVDIYVPDPPC
jgi:hypothetical protein